MRLIHLEYACALLLLICPLSPTTSHAARDNSDHQLQSSKIGNQRSFNKNNENFASDDDFRIVPDKKHISTAWMGMKHTLITNATKTIVLPSPPPSSPPPSPPTDQRELDERKQPITPLSKELNNFNSSIDNKESLKEKRNNPPVMKERMGMITAYVGHLLVKRVPEETFNDLEDGSTRNLSLSLRFANRKMLQPNHWLQLDEFSQEFYGLPSLDNIGYEQYLLTAADSYNEKAYHIVHVNVTKRAQLKPQVEFYLTLDTRFVDIAINAKNKRRIVEKLAYILGYKNDTSKIKISSITTNPTTVKWYDNNLPTHRCPDIEINRISSAISADRKSTLKEVVEDTFDKDLKIVSIKILPIDRCIDEGELPREFTTIYAGASAIREPKLGASGLVNLKVGERKILSFVVPTAMIALIVLSAMTVIYLVQARRASETEFMPCLRVF